MIRFNCPSCNKALQCADQNIGSKAKCPGCGETVTVPRQLQLSEPQERQSFGDVKKQPETKACPFCGEDIRVNAIKCRFCHADLTIQSPHSGSIANSPKTTKLCDACGENIGLNETTCPYCGEKTNNAPIGSRPNGSSDYANFGERVIASIIDGLVMVIPVFGGSFILLAGLSSELGEPSDEDITLIIELVFNVVFNVLGWVYFATMESSTKQGTFGKIAMGLIVTDRDGRRLTFGRASGRWFAKLLSNMTFFIGYLMPLFTERKQTLHDLVAGCLVTKRTM
jgi:uncharacterized RDD family membrane protein YckC/predicted RNA-binding Zn-ribbon protein involved in translation (DUF1610 family)